MSTQQDIYAAGSKSRSLMLNKENYVPWSSRLFRYAKSRPNGKLIHNSIINGPYTDDELTEKELKQIEADDQAIQTILLGLPEDIYAGVDSCEIAQEIWTRRRDAAYLQTHLLSAQKEEAGIQLQAEEFDFIAAVADLDEIEEVNANCILMANLQQASTSGTQSDKAPVYDSDGSAENDNNVISEVTSVEHSGETVEQHPVNIEETFEVEKVNSVNRKLKETNADLTTELARYKNQKRSFEISQEKYDKLEKCYQQSVYQEQCLSKKINALHLSTGKQIMTLNEQLSELNKQLSKEKSIVSVLLEEKKKLKSDFKTYEDKLLDKHIQLEKKIKDLNNILFKTGQSIQTINVTEA
uniref:Uncharacterized protein n=1 Tax=Tanacetum cinerariifolium TaxID=118510 RepID=A0A6L2LI53_TANCI|nr:hypothetical protein [Tanacetum cinerariifolium]